MTATALVIASTVAMLALLLFGVLCVWAGAPFRRTLLCLIVGTAVVLAGVEWRREWREAIVFEDAARLVRCVDAHDVRWRYLDAKIPTTVIDGALPSLVETVHLWLAVRGQDAPAADGWILGDLDVTPLIGGRYCPDAARVVTVSHLAMGALTASLQRAFERAATR